MGREGQVEGGRDIGSAALEPSPASDHLFHFSTHIHTGRSFGHPHSDRHQQALTHKTAASLPFNQDACCCVPGKARQVLTELISFPSLSFLSPLPFPQSVKYSARLAERGHPRSTRVRHMSASAHGNGGAGNCAQTEEEQQLARTNGGGGGGLPKPYPSLPSKVKPYSWPPSWWAHA